MPFSPLSGNRPVTRRCCWQTEIGIRDARSGPIRNLLFNVWTRRCFAPLRCFDDLEENEEQVLRSGRYEQRWCRVREKNRWCYCSQDKRQKSAHRRVFWSPTISLFYSRSNMFVFKYCLAFFFPTLFVLCACRHQLECCEFQHHVAQIGSSNF